MQTILWSLKTLKYFTSKSSLFSSIEDCSVEAFGAGTSPNAELFLTPLYQYDNPIGSIKPIPNFTIVDTKYD